MIRFAHFAALLTFVATTPLLAQPAAVPAVPQPQPQPLSQQDKEFFSYAAEDNQAEIALCLLAEKKAHSPAVKAFARLMVDDHVAVESRLAVVANAEKAELPEGVGEEGKKTHDKLDPLTGSEFETAFLKAQISDHENDLKRFDHETSTTNNVALRQFASETGPILEQHLDLAKAIQSSANSK